LLVYSRIKKQNWNIFLQVMFRNGGDVEVPDHQETWQDRGLAYCDQLELQPIPQTENGFLTGWILQILN
jgi:hypothetical protein